MPIQSQYISVTDSGSIENSSWVYLADWIMTLIIGFAFIFFFHRLVGWIASEALRILLWNTYRVKVTFESLKISFLGGRIFAKNVTITTTDQTVTMLKLTLTWRYWIFRLVRLPEYYFQSNDGALEAMGFSKEDNEILPCRILLNIDGLEVFIYNRKVGYDNIMDILKKEGLESDSEYTTNTSTSLESGNSSLRFRSSNTTSDEKGPSKTTERSSVSRGNSTNVGARRQSSSTLKFLLRFFPVHVRVKKGAIVMGNVTTPSILVLSYNAVNLILDITKPLNYLDHFRYVYTFDFDLFNISMKPNLKFDKSNSKEELGSNKNSDKDKTSKRGHRFFFGVDKIFRTLFKRKNSDQDEILLPAYENWVGLKRYVGDQLDEDRFIAMTGSDEEYAKFSSILDSVSSKIIYYYDVPGINSFEGSLNNPSPIFGMDIELSSTTIHYGPWAEKQRTALHSMFFPPLTHDARPTKFPRPAGELRLYEGFELNVSIKDEAMFRIPIREPSKDKEVFKNQTTKSKPHRPFGWIELKMEAGSTISSFTSYIAYVDNGWPNTLLAHFNKPEIRTSVNHDILFSADSHEIKADLTFPLEWNGKCTWTFDFTSTAASLFYLKEHTLLFSDIFADFGSGAPVPYELFRPFQYNINWKILSYKLFLNINDCNIINNPLDFTNNKYFSFQGDEIDCDLEIPLYGNFSKSTTIKYDIRTSFFNFVLDNPIWHTTHSFMDDSNIVGKCHQFNINGSYTFFSAVEVNASNTVVINCVGDLMTLKLYGFVVRFLFTVKENYFGHFAHFKTFEEYNDSLERTPSNIESSIDERQSIDSNNDIDYWKRIKTENDVDFLFSFQVRRGLMVLPLGLFNTKSHIGLSFDFLDIDCRFTEYYVDVQADFSPVKAKYVYDSEIDSYFDIEEYLEKYEYNSAPDLQIDGLDIHAHRMLGFVPISIMYYCKWDFSFGNMRFDSSIQFLAKLAESIHKIGFCFMDLENGLNAPIPIVYDTANFTFRFSNIQMKLNVHPLESTIQDSIRDTIMLVDLENILVGINDVGNHRYSSKMTASIPLITIKLTDEVKSETSAYLTTSLTLSLIVQKEKMEELYRLKQNHLKSNDAPFHRTPFVLSEDYRDETYKSALGSHQTSLSLPNASYPLNRDTVDMLAERKEGIYGYYTEDDSSFDYSSHISFEGSNEFSGKDDAEIHVLDYLDRDFIPSKDPDPKFSYDNIIVDLGEANMFLTPESIHFIAEALDCVTDLTLESLMDSFQMETVLHLNSLMHPKSEVSNIHFYAPDVQLKMLDKAVQEPSEVFTKAPRVSSTTLSLSEASFFISSKHDISFSEKSMASAIRIKEAFLSVSNPKDFSLAMYSNLKDIEAWKTVEDDDGSNLGSFSVEELDVSIDQDRIHWIIEFIFNIRDRIDVFQKRIKETLDAKNNSTSYLIQNLAAASKVFQVDHDPNVLTKPTYMLRAKSNHVRFYDSWKLMTRLRHILRSSMNAWKIEKNSKAQSKILDIPEVQNQDLMDFIFKWRNWEANLPQRQEFYNSIFAEDMKSSGLTKLQGDLRNLTVKMLNKNGDPEEISVRDFYCSFSLHEELSESIKIIVNLYHVKASYSHHLFEGACEAGNKISLLNKKKSASSKSSGEMVKENSNKISVPTVNLVLNVTEFHQVLQLPFSNISLRGELLTSSILLCQFNGEKSFVFNFKLDSGELKFSSESESLFSVSISNSEVDFANSGDLLAGSKVANLRTRKVMIHFRDLDVSPGVILSRIINEDVSVLKNIVEYYDESPISQHGEMLGMENKQANDLKSCSSILDRIGDFAFNSQLEEFSFIFGSLSPLRIDISLSHNDFSIRKASNTFIHQMTVRKINARCLILSFSIMETEFSRIEVNAKYSEVEKHDLASVNFDLGYSRIHFPNITKGSEIVDGYASRIYEKAQSLLPYLQTELSSHRKDTHKNEGKTHLFKTTLASNHIRISTQLRNTEFSFDIEEAKVGIYNVANVIRSGSVTSQVSVPLHGMVDVMSARFSIVDKSISLTLSKIFEVNGKVSVLNDSGISTATQSLQIESQYFRVCLSPQTIFKMIEMVDFITDTKRLKENLTNLVDKKDGKKDFLSPKSKELSIRFSSIHILSNKFCIGFLFGNSRKDYPGLIIGAESFFAILSAEVGKFTLADAYFSVAKGPTSSTFYGVESEEQHLNRAFLPNLQLNYTIDSLHEDKRLRINMIGDELDVKFLSDSVSMLDSVIGSTTSIGGFMQGRSKNASLRHSSLRHPSKEATTQKDYISSLGSLFSSIDVFATFAGSKVLFHRLEREWNQEVVPSLFLHSPAVSVASTYQRMKKGAKKHSLKTEITTSPSNNVLFASCIPVVLDITRGVRKIMRSFNSKSTQDKKGDPGKDIQVEKILKDIDLYVGLRIDDQKVSLSCEPTARVAAVVGIEDSYFQLYSKDEEVPVIVVAAQVESITASLQHIYSREISGSISLKHIIFSSAAYFSKKISILSSASLSDVDAYINIKQYQDLDIFKDTWKPKEEEYVTDIEVEKPDFSSSELASNKNISSRFKEVSTTYAIPGVLTVIINNFTLKADIGQALGRLTLKLDELFAVSKKSTDWAYDLKLGLSSINLCSEGRLSGNMGIIDTKLHLAINWMLEGEQILDLPLILISGEIDRFQLKAAFDYHVFAIAHLEAYSIDVFNQKSEMTKDHLFITTGFKSFEIFMTSLTASTALDIHHTVDRMIQENRKSYKETLSESSKSASRGDGSLSHQKIKRGILETIKKLETKIEVTAGKLYVQVYPSSFDDAKTLVFTLDQSKAFFSQNEYRKGISNTLELHLNHLRVSLSASSVTEPEYAINKKIDDFLVVARRAKGGNIISFPSLSIFMRSFQRYESMLVEYIYNSSFGGTVDVRWNLGSINFIREMFSIHKNALESRIEYRKNSADISFNENVFNSALNPSSLLNQDPADPLSELDQVIGDTLTKVSKASKYEYVALTPPVIEAPMLRELGNATPPLEWFGLHRDKFPSFTHEVGIHSLQKFVNEIERRYSKILGKA